MGATSRNPASAVWRLPPLGARQLHEQWHVDRLAIEQDPVLRLAVVVEPFAVVRDEHHQRLVVAAELAQPLEQLAERRVGRRDLALVRRAVARELVRRGCPGRVRLVEVDEEEEGPAAHAAQPGERARHGRRPVALHLADGLRAGGRHHLVVGVEALVDARGATQHERRDGGPRRVAPRAQHGGERLVLRLELVADVVAHAVLRRQQAGEQRGVRRERERRVAVRVLEHDRVALQPFDRRRLDPLVAVGRQAVGAQGVDRHQHDRRIRGASRMTGRGATAAARRDEQREERWQRSADGSS